MSGQAVLPQGGLVGELFAVSQANEPLLPLHLRRRHASAADQSGLGMHARRNPMMQPPVAPASIGGRA